MKRFALGLLAAAAAGTLLSTMTATAVHQSGAQPLLPSLPEVETLGDDVIHAVQLTADALDPVLGEYIDVYGLHAADWENGAIVVYLTDGARTAEAQEALTSAAAAVPGGVDLRFETAPVAMEELD